LIECLTDNRNRTLSNIKMAIGKNGGNFAETGSVAWMFDRKGVVSAERGGGGKSMEELELELIDAGAEDIDVSGDVITVTTDAAHWAKARDVLKAAGFTIGSAGLQYVPNQKMQVTDAETAKKLLHFVEAVEEDDDVSEVHTNADLAAEVEGTCALVPEELMSNCPQ
jgi:YebC/PmpR family DNA-binding regulatory protein